MGNYSKILVAFDGSESSRNALEQALANFQQSWLKVLVVVPDYDGDLELVGVSDLEGLLRGPTQELEKQAREITGGESARVSIEVSRGVAHEKIIDTAEEESCTLIVMGRRGLHRVERMLMGSVTAKVIVHTAKDVLVVPRDAVVDWGKIVLAMDGSPAGEAALDKALSFARDAGSSLQIVSVVDMYPENYADAAEVVDKLGKKAAAVLDEARGKADAAGVAVETHVLHGDPAEEITSFARENKAGVIFMGNRGRSRLKKIFLGSVAQKVIGLAGSPVYVAKTG